MSSIMTTLNTRRVNAPNGDHSLKAATLTILNCRRLVAISTISTEAATANAYSRP